MSHWNSIVVLYFKGASGNTPDPQKGPLNVSFSKISEKLIR